jgi:hypothetical protein
VSRCATWLALKSGFSVDDGNEQGAEHIRQ